jgi:hypothetical protein
VLIKVQIKTEEENQEVMKKNLIKIINLKGIIIEEALLIQNHPVVQFIHNNLKITLERRILQK